MAEICCGVVSGTEVATEACDPGTRTARRRRMEVRRFKFVPGVETMAIPTADSGARKRQRLEIPSPEHGGNGTEKDRSGSISGLGSGSFSGSGSVLNLSMGLNREVSSAAGSRLDQYCPRYGMMSVCGRRRDMEDAVSIRQDFLERSDRVSGRYHFFGVFDGHGCSHVAVSCKDRMHEIVSSEMGLAGVGSADHGWKGIMERSFSRMDAEVVACPGGPQNAASCRCELQVPKCDHVGSTAVVAVVGSDCIVVANCGDSRAVLCRKGKPVPLSCDHKPDRPDELERIQAAGGRVIYWDGARVLGVLAMSRAIGDSYLKPFVVAEPETTVTERSDEDECLIIASDGLWDVVTNEMACDIARMCLRGSTPSGGEVTSKGSDKACSDAAMLLTKLAIARQSADNVSVIVVDLRRNL